MNRSKICAILVSILIIVALSCIIALGITLNRWFVHTEQADEMPQRQDISAPTSNATETKVPEPDQSVPVRNALYSGIEMTEAELAELAAVVYLEAGNQSAKGQQAVVEVVLNRVLHSAFPDTVHDVLHQGENSRVPQFSTVYAIKYATPTQAQYDAINGALYGDTILDADVVFFSRNGENDRVWGQIGDHIFCREYIWR